ncbi:MAG: 2-oxo acid dehydrogenase subunit E2 [Oscillospiraceae bacterium]|nr:2-oxo acid dehydrogenase subunit E2 [Oscillospiraceae bacterium]
MGRVDGTRVRVGDEGPMYYLVPQFMTERHDAMNMTTVDIPVEPMRKYLNKKRREGVRINNMSLILAAYVQMVSEFPSLNRFVVRRRIYQHNDISVSLVVLRPGDRANNGTMGKLYFDPEDTIFDVQRKLDEYVEKNASPAAEDANGLDKIMGVLCKLGGLLDIAGWLLRFMDRHGLLPKALVDVSPFHASLLMTNLTSIRTNHIYHHVYDFGTTSIALAMGNMREVPKRGKGGEIELVHCLPLGIVMDERIASGHYFALAFARLKELLANPELLEHPVSTRHLKVVK